MKKILVLGIILSVVYSCTEIETDSIESPTNSASCRINATIEQESKTRADIDYFGEMSWTGDDAIGVFGEKSSNVRFRFVENESNCFWGNFDTQKERMEFAYYPYNEHVELSEDTLKFKFAETQIYEPNNKAPMFGKIVSEEQVNFYQTGGVLALKLVALPENASMIQITSDEGSPLLSGDVAICDIKNLHPTFIVENGKHTIKYLLSDIQTVGPMVYLYVPLQIGYYKQLSVSIVTDDDVIYKEFSLSDLEVRRGTLVNTRTINGTGKLYYSVLPDSAMYGTMWNNAIMTSADALITWKTDEKSTLITVTSLRDLSLMNITTDSMGNITNIFNDKEYISLNMQEDGSAYVCLLNGNGFQVYENVPSIQHLRSFSPATRAGVDKLSVISTIKDAYDLKGFLQDMGVGIVEEDWERCAETLVDQIELGQDEIDLYRGLKSAKGNPYGSALEVGAYAESKVNSSNKKFYDKLCGATITNIEPVVVNGKIRFGYSIRNTSNIPSGNQGYEKITRKCYAAVKKVPNGSAPPRITTIDMFSPKYGEREVISDLDEYFEIPYEKGYTYYIISKIVLTTKDVESNPNSAFAGQEFMHTVTYTSDMSYIMADNIGEIEINSINYENNQVVFDFNIWGHFIYNNTPWYWGIDLYHNGCKVEWDYIFPMGSGFRCKVILDKDDFDCNYKEFKATAKGKWQLGNFIQIDGSTSVTYSQLVDFDKLIYNTQPSLIFVNPIIQKTETLQTRSSSDDDDSEKYITFFSYGIEIKGGFWMRQYTAQSDTEGPIGSLSSTQAPMSDGKEAYNYSWVYSKENPISPTLWYDVILVDGTVRKSANELKFTGCPIDDIDYQNLFWE